MNKKGQVMQGVLIGVGVFLVILLMFGLIFAGMYNGLVRADTSIEKSWGNVQSAYQRRADLIPNVVATVKAYSDYEGSVLTEVTEARASVGRANTPAELQEAGQQLDGALSRLLLVVENYPDLKANENYLDLQAQLEGTENRIQMERNIYNKDVQTYKTKVRSFPTNIVAGMFGFELDKWDVFQSEEGADKAPNVDELFE